MIFISGIHGVGKTYFTEMIKEKCNIESYTASELITEYKGRKFNPNKKVSDISNNQQILLKAIKDKTHTQEKFLLNGHFCLLDQDGKVKRIELGTYFELEPKAIVLLTERAEIIAERRTCRDGIECNVKDIMLFQDEEKKYGLEVAQELKRPIFISKGSQELDNAIDFILQYI